MTSQITQFSIKHLHGYKDVIVPLRDNRLILVGENGMGKSTVVNLMYFFLTRQWRRLLEYDFDSISAIINDKVLNVASEEIQSLRPRSSNERIERFARRLSPSMLSRLRNAAAHTSPDLLSQNKDVIAIADATSYPISLVIEYLISSFIELDNLPDNIAAVDKFLLSAMKDQILYLPTYRRIEQDLKTIFPSLDLEDQQLFYNRLQRRSDQKVTGSRYIELVEFGMEDVQKTVNSKMEEIRNTFRTGLSALTATYFSDIIRLVYKNFDFSAIKMIGDDVIEAILNRIDDKFLPRSDHRYIREVISKIKNSESIEEDQKVVAHFFSRLIEVYRLQQDKESDVRKFEQVCNSYLTGKQVVFDNQEFTLAIHQTALNNSISAEHKTIELRSLSSGEKQIVSLFSHIYLSGNAGYIIMIDEPELSLSVPWQKKFLTDLVDTNRCNGLIAVTHSPFIFDNSLGQYTHSLEEFIK